LSQVRIIVSGVGSWRYVDCVAIRAGKLQALEYVRQLYGVPLDRCVAAGDSGNDILMLEGTCRKHLRSASTRRRCVASRTAVATASLCWKHMLRLTLPC
jgi:phosphoserine phosphatase